jgi:hypothetical protein
LATRDAQPHLLCSSITGQQINPLPSQIAAASPYPQTCKSEINLLHKTKPVSFQSPHQQQPSSPHNHGLTSIASSKSPHYNKCKPKSVAFCKLQPSPLPPKPRRRGRSHHQPTNAITTPPPFSTLPQSPPLPCSQTTINTKHPFNSNRAQPQLKHWRRKKMRKGKPRAEHNRTENNEEEWKRENPATVVKPFSSTEAKLLPASPSI